MKKLTAGIFTVLMGLVSVNAADAAVASKGYVDKLTGDVATAFGPGTGVVAGSANLSQAANELSEAIGNMQSSTYINTLETGEKTLTGAVNDLDSRVTANTTHIGSATFNEENLKFVKDAADLTVAIKELDEAVTAASGDLDGLGELASKDTVSTDLIDDSAVTSAKIEDGAVATLDLADKAVTTDKIADNSVSSEKLTANVRTTISDLQKAVSETAPEGILSKAKAYSDEKDEAQTTAITTAYQAADATTLNSANDYTDVEIAKINNADTGILKQAKEYTNDQIDALDLQAISRVPAACGTAGNYCVLTTNGTKFVWEVIVREDTTLGEGDDGFYGDYPVTEPAVTQ